MAEPGEPHAPDKPPKPMDTAHSDLDDQVGFAAPAHLEGQSTARPSPETAGAPDPSPRVETVTVAAPFPEPPIQQPQDVASPAPLPHWARETPRPAGYAGFGERRQPTAEIPGASGLTAVYALILFAVPTLGVSALIALLAVTGRPRPDDATAASHFVFQQRTLWAGAVVALLGAILVVVGLGVFVLFALAVWLILRGAAGVLKLKAGRPIADPRGWLIRG